MFYIQLYQLAELFRALSLLVITHIIESRIFTPSIFTTSISIRDPNEHNHNGAVNVSVNLALIINIVSWVVL